MNQGHHTKQRRPRRTLRPNEDSPHRFMRDFVADSGESILTEPLAIKLVGPYYVLAEQRRAFGDTKFEFVSPGHFYKLKGLR
jgi:hypothetical protein